MRSVGFAEHTAQTSLPYSITYFLKYARGSFCLAAAAPSHSREKVKNRGVSPCFLAPPKAVALGSLFPAPISFVLPKETVDKAAPAFGGARLRLAASFFLPAQKETKNAPGDGRGGLRPPRAWPRSLASSPPDPRFYGGQTEVMQPSPSGVGASRHTLLPIIAAALLAVVETCRAHGTRLLSAGRQNQAHYCGPLELLPLPA